MAVKEGNTIIHVTMTEYHMTRLGILCNRTGHSKTGMVQRLIEQADLFDQEEKKLAALLKK